MASASVPASAAGLATASGLAFAAGCLAAGCAWTLLGGGVRRLPRAAAGAAGLVDAVVRVGSEGRQPGAAERRRLLLAGAACALALGSAVLGPLAGAALAAAGPFVVARVLRARRAHYKRMVDEGAAELTLALADAVGGGHSVRGALASVTASADGPMTHELGRVAAELRTGARTEDALESFRRRASSRQVDTLVAACLIQRRTGGDLARLLRRCAQAFEEESRLRQELRAATAQARFTGLLVVLLPLGGAVLAELASPGWFAGLWESFLTAWLVGIALALQLAAAVVIRRLGRVRW